MQIWGWSTKLHSRFGYVSLDTFLHRLNPSLKFFSLILIVMGIMIYPSWIISGSVLLIILIGFLTAGIKLQLSMKRVRFLILFSINLTKHSLHMYLPFCCLILAVLLHK